MKHYQPNRQLNSKSAKPGEDCFTILHNRRFPEVAIGHSSTADSHKIYLTISIESAPCMMEVDTGLSKSLVSWDTLKKLVPTVMKKNLEALSSSAL